MRKKYLIAIILIVIAAAVILLRGSVAAPIFHSVTAPSPPPPPNAAPSFNKQALSTTDPNSIWVVVNKQHPLSPMTYAPSDLTPVGNGQYMRAEAAQALQSMIADAKAAGYTLTPDSGYRSYATQVSVYNNEVKAFGQAQADSESARPGYSEHQTGLAIDLGSGGCNISDCFANTPGGKWVAANAYNYGFMLRYQPDLTNITGYRAEAWHFRYVGPLLSTELHKNNVATLEQFFNISGSTTYK